jgi:acetylornithine aminotransferase
MPSRLMNVCSQLDIDFVRGEGPWLYDIDGRRYFDAWNDSGVASLGYSWEELGTAWGTLARAESPHRLPLAYRSEVRELAAERLCVATGMDKVMFLNSGTEAIETAIKLARLYWYKRGERDRYSIVSFIDQFHGRTYGALAATDGAPYYKEGFGPLPQGFARLTDAFEWVDNFDWRGWEKVAAVILAPILGNSRVLRGYPAAFWQKLAELKERHGFLVIFDEVQVGMGRTGFICSHQHGGVLPPMPIGLMPDIVCLGKGLALGLPAAACLARGDAADTFEPGRHFTTFGGSPIVCSAILHLLDWLEQGGLLHVRKMGQALGAALKESAAFADSYGFGVHWAFRPAGGISSTDFCEVARNMGLLLMAYRPDAMIRFCPPLNVKQEELGWALGNLNLVWRELAP